MKNPFRFFSTVKKIGTNFEEINKKLFFIKNVSILIFVLLMLFSTTYLIMSIPTKEVLI